MNNDLVLRGLTMRVENPDFVVNAVRYSNLVRQLRAHQRSLAETKRIRHRYANVPEFGFFTVVGFNDTLKLSEEEIMNVINDGTYVEKPPQVQDERNDRIRKLLLAVINDEPSMENLINDISAEAKENAEAEAAAEGKAKADARKNAGEVETPETEAAAAEEIKQNAEAKAKVANENLKNLFARILVRFSHAVVAFDWSETRVSAEELKEAFGTWMELTFKSLIEPKKTHVLTDKQRYEASVVTAMPVTRMFDEWLTPFLENKLANLGTYKEEDVKRALETMRDKITLVLFKKVGGDKNEPYPDVDARDKALKSENDIADEFRQNLAATIRTEAIINKIGNRPSNLSDVDIMELQAMQAARVTPSEETMRTRLFRMTNAIDGVASELEARIARVQYDMPPVYIDVPLVVERDIFAKSPLTMKVYVAKEDNTVVPDGVYLFEWNRVGIDLGDDLHHSTFRVPEDGNVPTSTYTTNDPVSDRYYARVQFLAKDPVPNPIFVTSDFATIRFFGTCVRCDKVRFNLSEPRKFGECVWQTYPPNRETLAFQQTLSQSPLSFAFLTTQDGYRPDVDDAVPVRSEDELLKLALIGREMIRARYFKFDAVVDNMMKRVTPNVFMDTLVAALGNAGVDDYFHFNLDESSVALVASRTASAHRLSDIPLLAFVVGTQALANRSEWRFLSTIKMRLLVFVRLFRHVEIGGGISEASVNRSIALLTANDVLASDVWYTDTRYRTVFTDMTPQKMFVDEVGEERFWQRVEVAKLRFDYEMCEYDAMAAAHSNEAMLLEKEMTMLDQMNLPFGVPASMWRSERTPARVMVPLTVADWIGVHSYDTEQAIPESIYEEGGKLIAIRGSARLRTTYDFDGLHEAVEDAVRVYNTTPSTKARDRVTTLVSYYNILAQFAPALRSKEFVPAKAIIDNLDARQKM